MENKNIFEKLLYIQQNLKVPKGQYNSFGKYKYRACEDILEAVKPLLVATGTTLVIGDELLMIGDRYYVKATADLIDIETKERIVNTAYAREEEVKKGMDGSQITGSSSSYARKYALNGLFSIDDTKDSDYTNDGTEPARDSQKTAKPKGKTIGDYKKEFASILKVKEIPFERLVAYLNENYRTDKIDGLNMNQLENLRKTISEW